MPRNKQVKRTQLGGPRKMKKEQARQHAHKVTGQSRLKEKQEYETKQKSKDLREKNERSQVFRSQEYESGSGDEVDHNDVDGNDDLSDVKSNNVTANAAADFKPTGIVGTLILPTTPESVGLDIPVANIGEDDSLV